MASYRINIQPSADRDLRRLPTALITRIARAIDSLAEDPLPRQSVKLQGDEDAYRLRVGSYRVIYAVDRAKQLVTVFRIGHRREVYRGL